MYTQICKDIELDALGHGRPASSIPYCRLHDGDAQVMGPGMLFPSLSSRGYWSYSDSPALTIFFIFRFVAYLNCTLIVGMEFESFSVNE